MLKRGDLRGLSKIATILLITLIVLLIVAFFVIKDIILKGSGDREIGKFTLDLEMSRVQVVDNNSLVVVVKRDIGKGNFTGINFIVDDGKNTEIIQTNASLAELESRTFFLNLVTINASEVKKISIDVVFKFETEKDFGKNIKDVYFFDSSDSNGCKPYCPEGAECGSNSCGGECAGGCTQPGYFCSNRKCVANLEVKCLQANVSIREVSNVETNFSITLSRQGGEDEIGGVILIFTDENESSNLVIDIPGDIAPLSSMTKYATILESHLENPKKVKDILYFIDDSGSKQLCKASAQFEF